MSTRAFRRLLRGRRRDDRGAVALEAAIVLPMICLLVFGMIEFSLMLRDYVSVTAATRAGSRLASAEADAGPCTNDPTDTTLCTSPANTPEMAQDAANAMDRALTGVPRASINYVLVYEANKKGYPCLTAATCPTETGATMPSSCTGYANCVRFTWNASKGAFRYSSGSWTSSTINACLGSEDSVGIYLDTTHAWLTGLFGSSMSLNDRAVMKFEPLAADQCDSHL